MTKSRLTLRLAALSLIAIACIILWRAGLPASPNFFLDIPPEEWIEVPRRGGVIPAFTAQTLEDATLTIDRDLGHPVILNFWATWCEPCVAEMPALNDLYLAGVPVVGVNVGREDIGAIHAWTDSITLDFPIVVDDASYTIEARYQINAMPTTFFVDETGIIRYVERGLLTEEAVVEGLAAIGFE